jgi:hypothetical protein
MTYHTRLFKRASLKIFAYCPIHCAKANKIDMLARLAITLIVIRLFEIDSGFLQARLKNKSDNDLI